MKIRGYIPDAYDAFFSLMPYDDIEGLMEILENLRKSYGVDSKEMGGPLCEVMGYHRRIYTHDPERFPVKPPTSGVGRIGLMKILNASCHFEYPKFFRDDMRLQTSVSMVMYDCGKGDLSSRKLNPEAFANLYLYLWFRDKDSSLKHEWARKLLNQIRSRVEELTPSREDNPVSSSLHACIFYNAFHRLDTREGIRMVLAGCFRTSQGLYVRMMKREHCEALENVHDRAPLRLDWREEETLDRGSFYEYLKGSTGRFWGPRWMKRLQIANDQDPTLFESNEYRRKMISLLVYLRFVEIFLQKMNDDTISDYISEELTSILDMNVEYSSKTKMLMNPKRRFAYFADSRRYIEP